MQLLTMRPPTAPAPVLTPSTPGRGGSHDPQPGRARSPHTLAPIAQRLRCAPSSPQAVQPGDDPALPRDIASRFGRRVRALRQAREMTQVEVAVHFGIDRTFLSDVERGRKSVGLPTMEIFALGFGLSLSDLLRGL